MSFSSNEIASERMHYRVLAESYKGLIDGIKTAQANGTLSITERQAREIIRTLSRAQRDAEDGVELWSDE